jgi:hypothetical protein
MDALALLLSRLQLPKRQDHPMHDKQSSQSLMCLVLDDDLSQQKLWL